MSAVVAEETVETKQFHAANLESLNSSEFWNLWARAGGDCDEYVKETMPNYGIVGALLLTITIPMSVEPITFGYNDDDAYGVASTSVNLYVLALNISTACSMVQIIFSMAMFQQYVNAYSKPLRIKFAAKFGHVVSLLTTLLIIDIGSLFFATFIGLIAIYKLSMAIACIALVSVSCGISFLFYIYMTTWNANTYSKQIPIDIKAAEQAEANDEGKSTDDVIAALENLVEVLKKKK